MTLSVKIIAISLCCLLLMTDYLAAALVTVVRGIASGSYWSKRTRNIDDDLSLVYVKNKEV